MSTEVFPEPPIGVVAMAMVLEKSAGQELGAVMPLSPVALKSSLFAAASDSAPPSLSRSLTSCAS